MIDIIGYVKAERLIKMGISTTTDHKIKL